MISVLVVDDQPMMRTGLRYILEAEPDLTVSGEAADGETAVAGVRQLDRDVVIMDIRMPGMDGIEATRRIVASHNRTRVLIFTTFDIDGHILDALRAGASGFLVKDDAPDALVPHRPRAREAGPPRPGPCGHSRLRIRSHHARAASSPVIDNPDGRRGTVGQPRHFIPAPDVGKC